MGALKIVLSFDSSQICSKLLPSVNLACNWLFGDKTSTNQKNAHKTKNSSNKASIILTQVKAGWPGMSLDNLSGRKKNSENFS